VDAKIEQDMSWKQEGTFSILEQVELSDWQCQLFGMGSNGITLIPPKGKVPNWFWRWMQFLCFGNRWERRK